MAISITSQPTTDGKYSAYFPLKITATETANPDYLYFLVRKSDGTAISGVPYYKAANVNNTFTFDASNIIKALLQVRNDIGLSKTSIEDLTALYGKYEVIVNTTETTVSATVSNEFYCFPFLDNTRYLNDQTANYAINYKELLFASPITTLYKWLNDAYIGDYSRINIFVKNQYIYVNTYGTENPNIGTSLTQVARLDVSAYIGRVISVPMNTAFIFANFTLTVGTTFSKFSSWAVYTENVPGKTIMFFKPSKDCNKKEFVFINRYGVKESILFKSKLNTELDVKSDYFMAGGYDHTGRTTYFNTSAKNQKINQNINKTNRIEAQKFLIKQMNTIEDFIKSPIHWYNNGTELEDVTIGDGNYKLIEDGRGLEINFEYFTAQKQLSFI